MAGMVRTIDALNDEIVACERCPRLIAHCRQVARVATRWPGC
jgi:hypothetical protein